MKDKEELFKKFLEEYLDNVKMELPESYRAKQLRTGNIEAALVYKFEDKFLRKPFMRAIEQIEMAIKDELMDSVDDPVALIDVIKHL
jgi:hypothetical protein